MADILRAGPTQPARKPVKSLSHFCRKYRPEGRFCRLCRFITTAPSTTCDSWHFLTRKRSLVRIQSCLPFNSNSLAILLSSLAPSSDPSFNPNCLFPPSFAWVRLDRKPADVCDLTSTLAELRLDHYRDHRRQGHSGYLQHGARQSVTPESTEVYTVYTAKVYPQLPFTQAWLQWNGVENSTFHHIFIARQLHGADQA